CWACRTGLPGEGLCIRGARLRAAFAGKPTSPEAAPHTFEPMKTSLRTLTLEQLSKEAFAPFGDVIETDGSDHVMINNGSTMRFHKLATVGTATPEDNAIISIFRADAQDMPLTVCMLERHPLGSQAFIPLRGNPFLIVVAPLGDEPVSGL